MKVAVIGVGHLGQHHARIYSLLDDVELVGVVDTNQRNGEKIAGKYNTVYYRNISEIFDKVDAVSVSTPTSVHYEIARKFLARGIHTLVEKPITADPIEAQELVDIADGKNAILQVGHIERYNAAVKEARKFISAPRFIEVDRLSRYPARSLDIGVVLDLMIHDIDIILSFVKSPVKKIDSVGATVLSKFEDIANCRIAFENGCVANVTASRVSYKSERKFRVFEPDRYISLDFQKQRLTVYRKKKDVIKSPLDIDVKKPRIKKTEPLREELSDFINCVKEGRDPSVSGYQGLAALKLALEIIENIKK
ncbi:MAG: Gfo/Idh/MocA family oxidoreductase [Elusimicrobia bacterium]|nr:Gfo/Idh/MocA family oxidoreductase [Elusimicrobiota bacterium]